MLTYICMHVHTLGIICVLAAPFYFDTLEFLSFQHVITGHAALRSRPPACITAYFLFTWHLDMRAIPFPAFVSLQFKKCAVTFQASRSHVVTDSNMHCRFSRKWCGRDVSAV